MTKTQNWVFAGVSAFALITGILLATGAVTFAQTDEPTPTPSASGGSSGGSSPPPHPSPGNEQTRRPGGGHYVVKETPPEGLGVTEKNLSARPLEGPKPRPNRPAPRVELSRLPG